MENKIREQIIKMVKDNYNIKIDYNVELPEILKNEINEMIHANGDYNIDDILKKYVGSILIDHTNAIQDDIELNLNKIFNMESERKRFIKNGLNLIEQNAVIQFHLQYNRDIVSVTGLDEFFFFEESNKISELIKQDVFLKLINNTSFSEIKGLQFIRENQEIINILGDKYDNYINAIDHLKMNKKNKKCFMENVLDVIEKNLSINIDFKTKDICIRDVQKIADILPSEAVSRICEMIQYDVEYLIFTINTPLSEISNFNFIRKNKEIIAIIENVYDGIYYDNKKKDVGEMGSIEALKIVNKNTCAILPTSSLINSILKKLISSNCGVHVSYNDDINDMIVILDYVSMMEFGLDVNEFDLSTGVIKEAIKRTIIQSGDTDSVSGNYNIDLKNVFNMVEQVYSEMVSNMKKVNFN